MIHSLSHLSSFVWNYKVLHKSIQSESSRKSIILDSNDEILIINDMSASQSEIGMLRMAWLNNLGKIKIAASSLDCDKNVI